MCSALDKSKVEVSRHENSFAQYFVRNPTFLCIFSVMRKNKPCPKKQVSTIVLTTQTFVSLFSQAI